MSAHGDDTGLGVPDPWRETADRIAAMPGLTVVLGESDTGKSTFCAFLVGSLCAKGAVGLVDADVGQSTLGPPMTIGGAICTRPRDARRNLHPPFLYFTGASTPERRLLESVLGAARVTERVRSEKPRAIVVDTTGLVHGESGRRLKIHKVQWLRPSWIVALQRAGELEPLLACFEGEGRRVVRLQAAAEVKHRSREQRRRNRQAAYAEYFANAKLMDIEIRGVSVFDCPENIADAFGASAVTMGPACAGESLEGLFVGLNDAAGDTLAVGRIASADWARGILSLSAPPVAPDAVTSLKIACAEADGTPGGQIPDTDAH